MKKSLLERSENSMKEYLYWKELLKTPPSKPLAYQEISYPEGITKEDIYPVGRTYKGD